MYFQPLFDVKLDNIKKINKISYISQDVIKIQYVNSNNEDKKVYYNGTLEDWCNMKIEDSNSANPAYGSYLYMINSNREYEQVKQIIIPETIKSIGDYQFNNIYDII